MYENSYNNKINKSENFFIDIIDLFINQTDIHILRAIDPTLKIRYHNRTCHLFNKNKDKSFSFDSFKQNDFYKRCIKSQKKSLGSKTQLINLVFQNLV